ncbi:MAG: acyl carrier protein [Alphaproteobacteria bacterium]|nr:acyl carrier protein [Alphaproteobacteria bacterium]
MESQSPVDFLMQMIREDQKIPGDDPDFTMDVDLFDYGYIDSFGIVNLIASVKQAFGVDMSMVDFYAPDYRTVRGIAGYVESRKGD